MMASRLPERGESGRWAGRGEAGWTNRVLIASQPHETIYFLPTYMRFKLKHFVSIQLASQQAVVNGDLILTFHHARLPPFLLHALRTQVILHFNRSDSVRLCRSTDIGLKHSEEEQTVSFTLRREFTTGVESKYFLWPFEMVKLLLVVTVRSLSVENPMHLGRPILLRFNCMDHPDRNIKFSYNPALSIGSYCLAPKNIAVFYSRQPKFDLSEYQFHQEDLEQLISLRSDRAQSLDTVHDRPEELGDVGGVGQVGGVREGRGDVGYYQYGHFVMGVYHYPFATLFGLLLPMWSLALYNLMIYFQGNDLSMRISNSVFIDLSLLDYIPTIRSQLPDTPNLLLVEVLLYSLAATFHLTMIDSYLVYQDSSYQMDWRTNNLFLISLAVTLLTVFIVLLLSLLHKCCWEKDYLQQPEAEGQVGVEQLGFNRSEWLNRECDQHFSLFPDIRPLQ